MMTIIPFCEYEYELSNCGMVLAWRGGLPHYRETALTAWSGLSDNLKLLTLGLDPTTFTGDVSEIGQKLKADRWYMPQQNNSERQIRIASVCGGFRGFGGPFVTPPVVEIIGGGLVASDREGSWLLHADAYGSTFKRLVEPEACEIGKNNKTNGIHPNGEIVMGEMKTSIEELADFSSYASTADMLLVALKDSHYVYVVAISTRD